MSDELSARLRKIQSKQDFESLNGLKFTILELIKNIEFLLVSLNESERDLGLELILYCLPIVQLSKQVIS